MAKRPRKIKYREYDFGKPVTMQSNIGDGYLFNGREIKSTNEDLTLKELLMRLGNQGWELMSVFENQVYLFKRPVVPEAQKKQK